MKGALISALPAFIGSLVESTEALTIVLAVGVTRGWRPALLGAFAGIAVLLVGIAAVGPALSTVPFVGLELAVGVLLVLFGMRWLRKAVLRAGGLIPLHDEAVIFERERAALAASSAPAPLDPVGFAVSFKAVILEGLEVFFIVVALGATGHALVPAAVGAVAAAGLVMAVGFAVHRPLSRIPENALKLAVGILLSAFGTFWTGEALGLRWPGGDASLLVLVCGYGIATVVGAALVRTSRGRVMA